MITTLSASLGIEITVPLSQVRTWRGLERADNLPQDTVLQEANPRVFFVLFCFLIPEATSFPCTVFPCNYASQVRTSLRISLQSSFSSILSFIHFCLKEKKKIVPTTENSAKLGKIHIRNINLQFTRARKIPLGKVLETAQKDKVWEFRKKS